MKGEGIEESRDCHRRGEPLDQISQDDIERQDKGTADLLLLLFLERT